MANRVEYSVEIEHGCHVIRGAVPMAEMAALLQATEQGDVADAQLSQRLGATIVYGPPEACAQLRRALGIGQPPAAHLDHATLKEKIDDWFLHGEVGVSSKAIAMRMLGASPEQITAFGASATHPHDSDDFRRCHELIEWVPEIRPRLGEMAAVSDTWAVLVEHWDELTAMLVQTLESGDERASQMYERMRELGC